MRRRKSMKKLFLLAVLIASAALAEIQPEPTGVIRTLPETWPPHWIIAHDVAFFHMSDGKLIVLDAASDDETGRFKGFMNTAFIGMFVQAQSRPEIYVAETFRSRGTRGERTDVVTIYDKRTLGPIGEVVIPPKRSSNMPTEFNLTLVDNEKLALVYNFTPAQSVSVVDVVARRFLAEIPTPGCALAYPMAGRAFSSVCSDGSLLTVTIGADGQQASTSRTEPFVDLENDPMMEKAVLSGGVAYFPTFHGNIIPVDLRGAAPEVGAPWSMLGGEQGGWRPGGLRLGASDAAGRLYFLMHPEGKEGTHKDPGVEIWVFDGPGQARLRRIELALPAISIAVTRDDRPLLVATNINMEIDVYDLTTGEHRRTLGNFGQETPLVLGASH
jgi:methylamine dehydrogenase heavy chain